MCMLYIQRLKLFNIILFYPLVYAIIIMIIVSSFEIPLADEKKREKKNAPF